MLGEKNNELQKAYLEIKAREERLSTEVAERTRMQEAYERQEEQLRQSQKMEAIGKLSGGMAHDFNNQLTVILLYAEAILEADKLVVAKQSAEKIRDAAEASATLTRQLLAFARKQMLKPRVMNLNDLITNLHEMLVRTLGEQINLHVVLGNGLGDVRVDPGQLEQALVNLVINSRDAIAGDTGRLTVETANVFLDNDDDPNLRDVEPGRYVMLAVSDDGPGISEAEKKLIFEPFFTTKTTGTGLGLSMVQGFVAQSGGSIDVLSENGEGTSFKIYLPRIDDVSGTDGQEDTSLNGSSQGSETILVVEDESRLCELVTQMLSRHGYNVVSALDAMEALRKVDDKEYDLILTDVVMPGMNGPELVEKLLESRPDLPFIYMSGYTEDAITHRGELSMDVTLIEKPFTTRELLSVLRSKLANSKA